MINHLRLLVALLSVFITSFTVYAGGFGYIDNAIEYENAKGELLDLFYPLGFSKKGHFCFVRIPADEAVGCFLWNFNVFNLKTNKTEYKKGFKHDDCKKITDINSLLKKYKILFNNKMIYYGIERDRSKILKFPLKIQDDLITADLKRIKTTRSKDGFHRTIYFLTINSAIRGSKIAGKVFEKSSKEIPFIYNSKINGYIKSPLGSRIAVIVEQELRGWEGPPNVSTFRIFGASLEEGFKGRNK